MSSREPPATAGAVSPGPAVDFDLHGLVRVRLLDATDDDRSVVARQLGPMQAPLGTEPDIVVRFVDRLPGVSGLRYLGVEDVGFTGDAFLVLRSKHKSRARVRLPLEAIGRRPEIVCERGVAAVPFLIPIVNLTVLGKGALALHASAFTHGGVGVVTTGWSKGGKTEALLAFTTRGARYVGDEWVYVSPDGRTIFGIPEPIRLWDWHLAQLPEVRERISRGDRVRLRTLATTDSLAGRVPAGSRALSRAARRASPLLRQQLHADVPPERLFGEPLGPLSASFDRLFLIGSHDDPEIVVEPAVVGDIARRMAFSLAHERLAFTACYHRFRFAFPEAANPLVDGSLELERDRLERLLASKPAMMVLHPYPVLLAALYEAMLPHVGAAE